MTVAVLAGILCGLGCLGLVHAVHRPPPPLETLVTALSWPMSTPAGVGGEGPLSQRLGQVVTGPFNRSSLAGHPRWIALGADLRILGRSPEQLATRVLLAVGAGVVGPSMLWVAARPFEVAVPVQAVVVMTVIAAPLGAVLPIVEAARTARERRHHFRVVLGSFIDLVVLSLAGGVGVEGALLAAAQASEDWAARRMARVLSGARQSGRSPWDALGRLGQEVGVDELVELSATLQLAGTEGARIRQSLAARAEAMRHHEQADAESAANAMTERLFVPGALLLIGFLLFVGYPAFSRIVGGF